jgi:CHAT domain-containing protein
VRVLKLYAANHLGNLEQMPKARRPVGDGQTGIVAGDQPARNNQQESQRGNEDSKPMMSGVIRGQNYSLEVLIILTLVFLKSRALRGIAMATTDDLEQMDCC